METYINEGQSTIMLGFDILSRYYFEMDGYSFCGTRSLEVNQNLSWISVNNFAITIQSTDGADLETTEDLTVGVTLDVTTVTSLGNSMEQWLMTAPEGMGDPTARYYLNTNDAKTANNKYAYSSLTQAQCKSDARTFDNWCHGFDDSTIYADYQVDGSCDHLQDDTLQIHCLAQQCIYEYCIWKRDVHVLECE